MLVSTTLSGTGVSTDESCWDPLISADGNVVVFQSDASNIDPLDTDFDPEDDVDVFGRNLATGTTYLISVNAARNNAGNGPSSAVAVNSDGTQVVLLSDASDLAGADNNAAQDVFVASLNWMPTTLAGDYNHDGSVNAADYVIVRKSLGTNVTPSSGADGTGSGTVDEGDFAIWREHFGETLSVGGAASLPTNDVALPSEISSSGPVISVLTPDNGPTPQVEERLASTLTLDFAETCIPMETDSLPTAARACNGVNEPRDISAANRDTALLACVSSHGGKRSRLWGSTDFRTAVNDVRLAPVRGQDAAPNRLGIGPVWDMWSESTSKRVSDPMLTL